MSGALETASLQADEPPATFLAGLLDEVEELNRQLERIEQEMQEALSWTAPQSFEE